MGSAQSDSYYHHRDNKVLPSHVDADSALSQGMFGGSSWAVEYSLPPSSHRVLPSVLFSAAKVCITFIPFC